ncbi:uncharacterized protein [Diadema setosum]|uniref:uncharacterized protein isoform X1 n=2 Tax=Diadema setosum TaxID=31175 RepID=UPI003B3A2FEA
MTVAVPVERYSPFPWKHASHHPCSEHQPYCCYHDKSSAASDGISVSHDVSTSNQHYNGFTTNASSLDAYTADDVGCAITQRNAAPRVKREDATSFRHWTMGGRSGVDEEVADEERHDREDEHASVCSIGSKKRKLSDMLDDGCSDCAYRVRGDMTMNPEPLHINPTEVVVRCCTECGPTQGCCNCDPDDFFPDVSSEIELPMCYDGEESKQRTISCVDSSSTDIMDNVIPDILPSCRTTDILGNPDSDTCLEGMIAYDRKRVLDISLHKMRCIDDPEVSLRRSVLIANMVTKLRSEIRQEDYCRTVLPKKRRSFRRTWHRSPEGLPESLCFYQGHQPRRRLADDLMWDVYPTNDMIPYSGGKHVEQTQTDDHYHEQSQDNTQEEEKNSLLGDIDSIFQSLMACVGGP